MCCGGVFFLSPPASPPAVSHVPTQVSHWVFRWCFSTASVRQRQIRMHELYDSFLGFQQVVCDLAFAWRGGGGVSFLPASVCLSKD